jgi:hypothetical protein
LLGRLLSVSPYQRTARSRVKDRTFPDGWAAPAGGFPAMTEHVAFLMKDLVPLAASFYHSQISKSYL